MEELAPLLEMQLQTGGKARLTVTGYSMMPMLRNRRDSVALITPKAQLKPGDIILYRRETGQYVLHRIIAAASQGYICCGDNQAEREPVGEEQVLGVVESFVRKGRHYSINHFGYRLYTGLWVKAFALRQPYIAVRRWLGRRLWQLRNRRKQNVRRY